MTKYVRPKIDREGVSYKDMADQRDAPSLYNILPSHASLNNISK